LIKIIFIVMILLLSLNARENPFFPATTQEDLLNPSSIKKEPTPLKRATLRLPFTARVIEGVSIHYKNIDGSKQSQSIEIENTIDPNLPIFISQNYEGPTLKQEKKNDSYEKIASIKLISFFENDKKLKVLTKDKIIRNFMLTKPNRIVFDLQRKTNIKSFEKKIAEGSLFTKISIGSHGTYYRVVIAYNGHYKYDLKECKDGYIFTLR